MGDDAVRRRIDYAEYLALEAATDRRHEWLDGEVYAMAGGTIEHGQLAMMVGSALVGLASGCGCKVFSADVKVHVRATGLVTYPDVSVVCGPIVRDPALPHALNNPAVLVEVLSDSTEAYDRGLKFAHYRQLPSLRDYVLVSQHRAEIEVYSRDDQGRWVLTVAGPGQSAPLTAMPGGLEVDRVFDGVALTPEPPHPGVA